MVPQRTLGRTGPTVAAVGLGGSAYSGHGVERDDERSKAVIRTAVEAGMTLLDTADFYGIGHNEELFAAALRGVPREQYVLSDKFGGLVDPSGRFVGSDGRPAAVKNYLAYSLRRLGTDHLDIYRPARLDPQVPIEETVGALAEMVQAGYVRHIGLSEVGAETIRRAAAVHPICDVQVEYALTTRGPERSIIGTCRELGIGITAYGVLSHGLLTGRMTPDDTDAPFHLPRLRGENRRRNIALVERLAPIAEELQMSTAQLALAWVLAKGDDIVAIVGANRPERIADNLAVAERPLDAATVARIEAALPAEEVAGERYLPQLMAMLDSEQDR